MSEQSVCGRSEVDNGNADNRATIFIPNLHAVAFLTRNIQVNNIVASAAFFILHTTPQHANTSIGVIMKARPSSARPANRPRHFDVSSDPDRAQQDSINELLPSSVPLNSAPSSSLPVNTTHDVDHATKSPPQSIKLVTGHTITASARQRPRPQSAKGSRPTSATACPSHLAQHPPPLPTLQSPLRPQGTTRLCLLVQSPPPSPTSSSAAHSAPPVGPPVMLGEEPPADSIYAPFPARKLGE